MPLGKGGMQISISSARLAWLAGMHRAYEDDHIHNSGKKARSPFIIESLCRVLYITIESLIYRMQVRAAYYALDPVM
jgi:hypothetical protein